MIFFAAAFGSMLVVSLLLCVKSHSEAIRSGFACCAAVCAVGSAANFAYPVAAAAVVVEKPRKADPVQPQSKVIAELMAAHFDAFEAERKRNASP